MKSLILLSFSLTFLTQMLADDSVAAPSEQVGDSKLSDEEQPQASISMQSEDSFQEWCLSPYHEMHASIRLNEARGIGYKDGYTTLEAFGIYDGWSSGFMPFVDIRGHVFNDGKLAGNLGIGERTLFTSINHTLGSYLYYDVRRVGHGLTVNQLSPGIELVGELMEYRINGYFPLGKQKGHRYGFEFDKFRGNSIILKAKQQQAMMGFDAEVGAHIPQNTTYDVYMAAGPYYFHSSNATAWGGRARILGRYKEYVNLEVAYSYDHLFRNVVQGSVAFTLPFGRKLQRCGKCCPQTDNLLLSRAAFAPSRFEIPVVKKVLRREKAINPATGNPWIVWFVNNTSHSAGTFASPFPTLLQAQNASLPNNMIYVFPGDGTTTGMNAGITLKNGQNFFGSGIKQQFSTTKGTITIPAFSKNNPLITNTAGNVVTLGNSNTVSGFNVSVSFANAFGIGSPNIINATVANNVITLTGAALFGVFITGSGTVNVNNNQIAGSINALSAGIALGPMGGTMNGIINNNFISGFFVGIDISSILASVKENFDFAMQGNTVMGYSGSGVGAVMLGTSKVKIIGNTITTNVNLSGSAILIEDDPSTISGSIIIQDNQVVVGAPNDFFGIQFSATNSSHWNLNALVTNNSVKGQGVNSMFTGYGFTLANTDTLCLTLNENTYTNSVAGSTAFNFNAAAGTINIDSIQGNVGGPVASTGNVNFVAPGTCGN